MNYDLFLLEISAGTAPSAAVMKDAYRKLLKKHHPDLYKYDMECTEKIIATTGAYQSLVIRLGRGNGKDKETAAASVTGRLER